MRTKNILIILVLLLPVCIFSQSPEPTFNGIIDGAVKRAKEISLYANTVDWEALKTKMQASAAGAVKLDDLKPAFELMLNALRDHHGNVRKTEDYSILANFTDHTNSRNSDNREFDQIIWGIVNDVDARFEYAMLPNKIGYLRIVGVGPQVDGQQEAQRIRNAIMELADEGVEKWIVDLRYNGGGNVNVMIDGIAPLYDTERLVSIQDSEGEMAGWGEVKNGDFWYMGGNLFTMDAKPMLQNPKIAVLTSRWTWSSGEFVAVGFKGQKNTRFFGETTGGYTTNNSWDIIEDKIALVISTGVYADRNGNVYTENVKPDVEILFEVVEDMNKDQGIVKATEWLLGN